jgi:cellulose synthase/poly-beta-1,6-N-acetylglucosamine synthase-like glycosyltransferase
LNKKREKSKIKGEVTIVIPAYNSERIIERCVNSVINQVYPKDKIKIIVVNDGSKDRTLEILNRMQKKEPRLTVYSIKNSGKSAAVNFAIKRVKTEFIAFLDSDTLLSKDTIAKSMEDFISEKIMAVTCKMVPLQKKGFLVNLQRTEYLFTTLFRKVLGEIDSFPVAPGYAIFKREFFVNHGYFDEDNITEDFEIALRVHKYGYCVKYNLDTYVRTEVPEQFKKLSRQRERWGYGTLYNLWKYRSLFNFKYGDLATFLLPTTFLGIFVLVFLLFLTVKNLLVNLINIIRIYGVAGYYNYTTSVGNILISLSNPIFIIGLFSFLFSIIVYFIIKKQVSQKISFFDYLVFLFVYTFMLAFFYVLTLIRVIRGKKFW